MLETARPWLRPTLRLLFGLLVGLVLFQPPEVPPSWHLEPSWQLALGYGFLHGWRAGIDFVITYGPLGALTGVVHQPELFWLRWAWALTFAAANGCLAVLILDRIKGLGPQLLFVAIALLLPPAHDSRPVFLIYAGAMLLLQGDAPRRLGLLGYVSLVAVLGLSKFSYLIASAPAIVFVGWRVGARRGAGEVAAWAGLASVLHFGIWCLTGQRLGDWPTWVAASLEIAAGYSEAMVLSTPGPSLGLGILVSLLLCGAAALGVRRSGEGLPALLLTAWATFLLFKSGFVRHGLHAVQFFEFAALAPFLLWARALDIPRARRRGFCLLIALATAGAICGQHLLLRGTGAPHIVGGYFHRGERGGALWTWPGRSAAWARGSLGALVDPGGFRARMDADYEKARSRYALPQVKQAVGSDPIDAFGVSCGALILNDLDYRGRPTCQSYVTYSPPLVRRNAEHLTGPRAPEWVLFDAEVIDGRLPFMADGQALLEVVRRYEPVLSERGFVLLRRRSEPVAPLELVVDERVDLAQPIDLARLGPQPKVISLEIEETLAGKVRRTLLSPPILWADLTLADGRVGLYRVVPALLEAGCLIDPHLATRSHLREFLAGEPAPRVTSLRLRLEPRALRLRKAEGRLRIWTFGRPGRSR